MKIEIDFTNDDIEILEYYNHKPHHIHAQRSMSRFVKRLLQKIKPSINYCINCSTELTVVDEDPNGDKNCVCARCRAEEKHDFDREPNVTFDRLGRRVYGRETTEIRH